MWGACWFTSMEGGEPYTPLYMSKKGFWSHIPLHDVYRTYLVQGVLTWNPKGLGDRCRGGRVGEVVRISWINSGGAP